MSEKWGTGPWFMDFDLCDGEGPLDEPEFNGRILDQDNMIVCESVASTNATLISAAPELYDALRVVEHIMPESPYKRIVSSALKKARGEA